MSQNPSSPPMDQTYESQEPSLDLTLSLGPKPQPQPQPQLPPQQSLPTTIIQNHNDHKPGLEQQLFTPTPQLLPLHHPLKPRRTQTLTLRSGKTETIPQVYPWSTNKRATIHTLQHLIEKGINTITGQLQCKRCKKTYEIGYNLVEKYMELASFIRVNKFTMHDRAPHIWMNPTLPRCEFCNQGNCGRPVISRKRSINWLFLLLGQMLGCCKLSELKYFCKHTENHKTGAKDRVLYLTYLGLCKQLDPTGPYDV